MAVADALTLIPLNRVAFHLGIDPFHFNGISAENRRNAYACNDVWLQYDWQASGRLSREAVAFALRQAEEVVVTYLKWWPIPQWIEEEVELPKHYKPEIWSTYNARGGNKSITTSYGFVQSVGRKTSEYIDSPTTVFSDVDSDGFDETVTVTFATTVTDEDELHIYYPDKDGRDEWEIRPIESITIAGGTATIVFSKSLIPLWNLLTQVPEDGDNHILVDGDDNTQFLQTVDVYRVYADESQQITFTYEPAQYDCTSVPCSENTDTGCLFIKNGRLGILSYSRADYTDGAYVKKYFNYPPHKGTIYYRAGKTDRNNMYPNRQMDQALERMISFYALSLVDKELCGCCNQRNVWGYMTKDLSEVTRDESHALPWNVYENPLGTTRIAIMLWKYLQRIKLTKSQHMV